MDCIRNGEAELDVVCVLMLIRLRRYYFYAYEETGILLNLGTFEIPASLNHLFFCLLVHATFEGGLNNNMGRLRGLLEAKLYSSPTRCGYVLFARTFGRFSRVFFCDAERQILPCCTTVDWMMCNSRVVIRSLAIGKCRHNG
jgi:hypothetical protein